MNILVCVKQVPDTTQVRIDPVTNTLVRDGVPAIVNTFDAYALENAARMKDADPDVNIVVVSMGPPNAEAALRECIAIAADKAYLVSGRAFGGSDTLATSYILYNAVKKIEELEGYTFDAIFCGKQAIDGDTAQVGPELGEHLGYPQVAYVLEAAAKKAENEAAGSCAASCPQVLEASKKDPDEKQVLEVLKEDPDEKQVIEIQLPCVLTFTKPAFEPRYPKIRRRIMANHAEITVLNEASFTDMDMSRIGLKGSPTHVKKSFVPVQEKKVVYAEGANASEKAHSLLDMLTAAHIL